MHCAKKNPKQHNQFKKLRQFASSQHAAIERKTETYYRILHKLMIEDFISFPILAGNIVVISTTTLTGALIVTLYYYSKNKTTLIVNLVINT